MWWLILCALGVVAFLIWAFCVARKLNALHTKVLKSRKALELALIVRAQKAEEMASSGALDIASAVLLQAAAHDALIYAQLPIVNDGLDAFINIDLPPASELAEKDRNDIIENPAGARLAVESELSRTLRLTIDGLASTDFTPAQEQIYKSLQRSRENIRLTRAFHNLHVSQARRVHRKRLTRIFHLAGNAPSPHTVDIDDR
ncbi:hypothetical protein [uncultured Arcanobacterium sp.]|uniref:hypothetical protein n=1 Tax=uncultured Arcanobacterium sp. TaxID=487520 RepID=UPI0026360707|nr:hypothetical protein [uncultured Arcanobacterium sp.]